MFIGCLGHVVISIPFGFSKVHIRATLGDGQASEHSVRTVMCDCLGPTSGLYDAHTSSYDMIPIRARTSP